MEKLRFEFALLPGSDGKSNIYSITSITTSENKVYAIPQELQSTSHHKEIIKTAAYNKVKNSLVKRYQLRRIWITMTEELKKTYIDEDGNLQFRDQYLEEVDQEQLAAAQQKETSGSERRPKPEWIDFEEVPERRKQPKRIQTLPAAAVGAAGEADGVLFSYVEPEECRCECHARQDDELPLLEDAHTDLRVSSSPLECASTAGAELQLSVHIARPFTADLDLHHDGVLEAEPSSSARRQ